MIKLKNLQYLLQIIIDFYAITEIVKNADINLNLFLTSNNENLTNSVPRRLSATPVAMSTKVIFTLTLLTIASALGTRVKMYSSTYEEDEKEVKF